MVSAVKRFDQALRVGNVKAANDNRGLAIDEWRKTGGKSLARRQLKARILRWQKRHPDRPFPEGNPPKTSGGSGGGRGGKGKGATPPEGGGPDKPGAVGDTRSFLRTSAKGPFKIAERLLRRGPKPSHAFGLGDDAVVLAFPKRVDEEHPYNAGLSSQDVHNWMSQLLPGKMEPSPVSRLGEKVSSPSLGSNNIRWLYLEGARAVVAEGLTDADMERFRGQGVPCIRNDAMFVAAASPPKGSSAPPPDGLWWQSYIGENSESKQGEGVLIAIPDSGFEAAQFKEVAGRIDQAWQRSNPDGPLLHIDAKDLVDAANSRHGTRVTYFASQIAPKAGLLVSSVMDFGAIEDGLTLNAKPALLVDSLVKFKNFAQDNDKPVIACFALSFKIDLVAMRNISKSNDEWRTALEFIETVIKSLEERRIDNSSYALIVVAAIGNADAPKTSTRPTLPGSLPGVIGVGAHGSDRIAKNTCIGHAEGDPDLLKPDVYAPGIDVSIPGYPVDTGTSYAAGMLTGIVANLISDDVSLAKHPQRLRELLLRGEARIKHDKRVGHSPQFGSSSA